MSKPVLATKLHIPPRRPRVVGRPRLIERLNDGLHCRLTLVSAPAGFGKTTLLSDWLAGCDRKAVWLSLDEGDKDPARFLSYLVAGLQTIAAGVGEGVWAPLQSPQPPPTESILTALLNDITTIPDSFVLVLDDYHVVDARPVDDALTYLLEHLPPRMHLVIATREDPQLPLARFRARGQLSELRVADLRFTTSEAAEFLNRTMGLGLSAEDVAALDARTEGWIAGLQLAALSMRGREDAASFIRSFAGSHRFVLDYLTEEVLRRQSESVQTFLLHTSILDRLCGPLCDAVMLTPTGSGQRALEYLEHANLFLVPLDDERRWYRYHHLFADLLRQRLHQSVTSSTGPAGDVGVAELHVRASAWYEDNGLVVEAFRHAAAANDVERAERLIYSKGMPRHLRGVVTAILDWLGSLPKTVLDARPALWVRWATLAIVSGQTTGVEERLQAAETALQGAEPDDRTRNLLGQIATARATLALTRLQPEAVIAQARRALEYLPLDNLAFRVSAHWTLGGAYQLLGDRAAAGQTLAEALSISQASGDVWSALLVASDLGQVQRLSSQLHAAVETYRHTLRLAGDPAPPIAYQAHLGLACIFYEWNDLETAEQHGQRSLQLARQFDRVIDRFVVCEVFLGRLKLARGDVAGAAEMLTQAEESARQRNSGREMPGVAAVQVLTLIRQGNLTAAARLAESHGLLLCQARVHLARGDAPAALAVLGPLREQMEAKGWEDERLKMMVLEAVALYAHGDKDRAVEILGDVLALAEPEGFVRLFVDEGAPMAELLSEAVSRGIRPDYAGKLLAALRAEKWKGEDEPGLIKSQSLTDAQPLAEPLSQRELEVLRLIAQGLSNHEICQRLYLALDTVKGHNRRIYDKLQAQRRTDAVARARDLGLL